MMLLGDSSACVLGAFVAVCRNCRERGMKRVRSHACMRKSARTNVDNTGTRLASVVDLLGR